MLSFKQLVLWLHLMAVVLWIGGLMYQNLVMMPSVRKSLLTNSGILSPVENIILRFQKFSHELAGIILLTGIINIINSGWSFDFGFRTGYWHGVTGKLLLLIGIFGIQIYQVRQFKTWAAGVEDAFSKSAKTPVLFPLMPTLIILTFAALAVYLGLGLKFMY